MTVLQHELHFEMPGRGFRELTDDLSLLVQNANVTSGLCNVFCKHTSASLILCENADPDVRADLESFFTRLVPDGDPSHLHDAEGPDDMPAHIRSVLTQNSVTLPICHGRLALGTWQGLYLWEHRHAAHQRNLLVTIIAD